MSIELLNAREKASILVEALPYIKKFYGKTVVIKYGGSAMIDCDLKQAILTDTVLMKYVGINPVIVHGGGPDISKMLSKVGIESKFVGGLRVTDKETMEIAEMVLVGKINKEIVGKMNDIGGQAIGVSGRDANLFEARKKFGQVITDSGEEEKVDIGRVGEIARVNPQIINTVINEGYIPVIAPIAGGEGGESFNVNADSAAGALAESLQADKLIVLTDVEGIMRDRDDPSSLISTIKIDEVPALIKEGVIDGGMIPKVECCVSAVKNGVKTTHILDGRVPHSILLEVFTDKGIGTMVE